MDHKNHDQSIQLLQKKGILDVLILGYTLTHTIHVWHIYLHFVDLFMVNVGNYASPMDGMVNSSKHSSYAALIQALWDMPAWTKTRTLSVGPLMVRLGDDLLICVWSLEKTGLKSPSRSKYRRQSLMSFCETVFVFKIPLNFRVCTSTFLRWKCQDWMFCKREFLWQRTLFC